MEIGFIGLGKMGMNMVTRLQRDHTESWSMIVSADLIKQAEGPRMRRRIVASRSRRQAQGPARGLDHGAIRRADRGDRPGRRGAARIRATR